MQSFEFYINKIKYIEGIENADVSFIPAISRRKMSLFDKVSAANLNACFNDDIENIVFASKTGEIERLLNIIEQYQKDGETSPFVFPGSVHNFAVSSFLMNKKKSIPYTALASGNDTFSSGLLAAVISKYSNSLFVYSDIENNSYVSICLNISKYREKNSKKFLIKLNKNDTAPKLLKDFYKLFTGEINKILTPEYIIESITDD